MKLIHLFQAFSALTSSGALAGFPVANVADTDPGVYWKAATYAGDCWLKINFGSPLSIASVFLNRANFPHCHIQGNTSDDWNNPPFDLGCNLVRDDAKNRKGWFDLTSFTYQWMLILIPAGQTLDDTIASGTPDTLPILGNLIAGVTTTGVATLPDVASLSPRLLAKFDKFETDAGGLNKRRRGKSRHVLSLDIGDTLANVRAMPKTWDIGVIFADLGNADEAWIVYPPDDWDKPITSVIEAGLRFSLEERP